MKTFRLILLAAVAVCLLSLVSCAGGGHTHTLVLYEGEAASCTEDGFAAYEACAACEYTTKRVIPALGHSFPDTYTTNTREHSRTCTVCAAVEAEEHTYDEGVITRVATCVDPAVKTLTCTVCARTRTVTVPGLGEHSYDTAFTVYDTHHENVCGFCDAAVAAPHAWEEVSVTPPADCREMGERLLACVCGKEKREAIAPDASMHTPGEWKTVVAAGVTTAGVEAIYCSLCNKKLEERTVGTLSDASIPTLYITGNYTAATKNTPVTVEVSYSSPNGDEFSCYATINWQGATSSSFPKKNYTMKLYKDAGLAEKKKVNFGWGKESKYCLKANWVDTTQARNIVACRLWADMVATRPASALRDRLLGLKTNAGAIDGFPIMVYMNGSFHGLYTLNVPKDEWMFGMDDVECEAFLGAENWATDFSETLGGFTMDKNGDWKANGGAWELKYFGTEKTTGDPTWVTNSFNNLIRMVRDSDDATFVREIGKYLDVDATIDYLLYMYAIYMRDNSAKNILWATYDGKVWFPSVYDQDGTFGMAWDGIREAPPTQMLPKVKDVSGGYTVDPDISLGSTNLLIPRLLNLFTERVLERYAQLRASVLTEEHILSVFDEFFAEIPSEVYGAEHAKWPDAPGIGVFERDYIERWVPLRLAAMDEAMIEIYNAYITRETT